MITNLPRVFLWVRIKWGLQYNAPLPPKKKKEKTKMVHGKLKIEQHESHKKKSGARVRSGASKYNIRPPIDSSADFNRIE